MAGMETTRTAHIQEIAALITSGVIYWLTIYPRARREIRRWKTHANEIPDSVLRAGALEKLTRERLNPEAAAFFAILAPRQQRARLVRLMVAFQVAYDYLDAINEHPTTASLRNGLHLHRALTDAVSSQPAREDYYRHHPQHDDGGYLNELIGACRAIMRELPSASIVRPVLMQAVIRCGEGQSHNHAVRVEGHNQLIAWTTTQQVADGYLWWEVAAGGISCLAIHALFAAAASNTTEEQAARVDTAYFPPICAISALLDSLVDHSDDLETANHSFTGHYGTRTAAVERFATITEDARALVGALAKPMRHSVILAGIACFYLSAPEAKNEFAEPVAVRTLACLGSIIAPMLAVMRLMRRSLTS
jgi:tetraprenyl-beta-curcumene synthase